ncbi:cache domain-containing protein, partial [Kushneria phosphatilytica]
MANEAGWVDQETVAPAESARARGWWRRQHRAGERGGRGSGGRTLKSKLGMTLALTWLAMIVIVFSMAWQSRTNMFEDRKQALTSIVQLAQGILETWHQRAEQGEVSSEEAKQKAYGLIQQLRFGPDDDSYVFAFSGEGRILSHPRRDIGSDVSDKSSYMSMLREAKAHGAGFVTYKGHLEKGSDKVATKVSRVSYYAPWDVVLATGVYFNDVDEIFYAHLVKYGLILLLVGGLVSLVFLLIMRNIYRDLGGEPAEARTVVARITEGDLSQSVAVKADDAGSLMYAIERMRVELSDTIAVIRRSSESIDVGAREIAAGNTDLSSRTEQQAASLEETAASMEELTATVRQNADNAGQASRLSHSTTESVQQGQEVITRVVSTMGEIRESSGKIADIITLIDGIAFQT